ncbi:hypothetical protein FV226_26175 [Methylobacterium sp. WL12]|uniref:hypothetical protein n=1 Tax=Methylobacterium sp. WL12 TaxID=2603890 RepID=UPI0011CABC7A|nr:hypothetical protein [Methylobacterium sp. WL12]TXM64690.1 hypothetical protein FV226_26175 [Methylobacterium sp. WL12]
MLRDRETSLEYISGSFSAQLPHTAKPYSSRAWGHPLHSLCSYQGKLKPALAHWLVRHFTGAHDHLLDPLGGVGTVAFEGSLLGRRSFSCDLSPFASTVARAKLAPPTSVELKLGLVEFFSQLEKATLHSDDVSAAEFGLNATVKDYYHPKTLEEILKARRIFGRDNLTDVQIFLKASLLHLLHGNRPYALSRTSHPITPFSPSGPFEYRSLEGRLSSRCERLAALVYPSEFKPGMSWNCDFRQLSDLLPTQVDAVICSPPFPGMRFDRPNWLRLWFCGWTQADFHQTSRNFLERQQGKNFDVYNDFFSMCSAVTKPFSPVLLHVGGSKAYDMAARLVSIGSKYLKHRSTITEDVAHIEKHGIRDKGTTSEHIILVFERI